MPNSYIDCPLGEISTNAGRHNDGTKIEYFERRDRLRQVLESRKAKSAAVSKANINDINNDAKKAK